MKKLIGVTTAVAVLASAAISVAEAKPGMGGGGFLGAGYGGGFNPHLNPILSKPSGGFNPHLNPILSKPSGPKPWPKDPCCTGHGHGGGHWGGVSLGLVAAPAYAAADDDCFYVRKRVYVPGVGTVLKRRLVCQ